MNIESGKLFLDGKIYYISDQDWVPHATCSGVFLKHLIKGESSSNLFSMHLVKVQSGSAISMHSHNENKETHEVITGHGSCKVSNCEIEYNPGTVAFIPEKVEHEVYAQNSDLIILAKFYPAIL